MDEPARRRLHRLRRPAFFGTLRRTTPLSDHWGWDRGTPIDRYYIERFLARHAGRICGKVLEVADRRYTEQFGRDVESSDVLDIEKDNPLATVVADLSRHEQLPEQRFDTFVLTQTLQYVFDVRAAVAGIHRLLRPGGTALVTVPAVSRVAHSAGVEGDLWRFTYGSCVRLFAEHFADVDVETYGNVLTCSAFLYGIAREELTRRELDTRDEAFPLVVAVRATRS